MPSKNIEDAYALSPMQQGMLFHTLYAPAAGMYIEQLTCTLRGELDRAAFKRAWQHVVDRHPVLRSAFAWKNLEQPLQVVGRQVGLPLQADDWRELSPAEQTTRLDAFLQADRTRGFDLAIAPLMRLALFQLAEDACAFVWTHHHLLLDGWSLPLVLGEVFQCYSAFAFDRPLNLPPLRPYRDYIAWLQRQDPAQAEAFWRQTLHGLTAPTPLGVDHPPAPDAPPSYAVQHSRLTPAVSAALDEGVRPHGLTLNTLVQGAWALLLGRYSGQSDVVFGATVAGRPPELPGSATMVGLFINTLPVRVQLPPDARVRPWLHALQAQQVEQRQYEYSALVQVQGWSAVPRRQPLFESLLVFENYPVGEEVAAQTSRPRLAVADLQTSAQTNYPLTIIVAPAQTLLLEISYDGQRFTAATITRMLGHLGVLLAALAAAPEARLADLPLLSAAEQMQLLVDWNATAAPYPHDQGLHDLIAAQAARTPDAIAVSCATEQLSYAALDAQASQLARGLRARGVGRESLVAVCLERSLELIVALLGVHKAGAAYVPLDPRYPPARLAFMLEDSGAALLITNSIYDLRLTIDDLEESATPMVNRTSKIVNLNNDVRLTIDDLRQVDTPIVNRKSEIVNMDNLAYVIYTSGSTGQPKGAMVTQRGLVNFAIALADAIELRPGRRLLQFASFSFDASALQVFPTLISGATLVLHQDPTRLSNQELLDLCTREQITILDLPASFWQQWVEDLAARNRYLPNSVAVCMTGGERLTRERLRTWQRLAERPVLFFSSYGPTEATITTTLFSTTSDQVDRLTEPDVPLGTKLPNTQIYLLDQQLRPVPIGVPGEVYIGGAGLARGYLGRPDLTAERFVPNPWGSGIRYQVSGVSDRAPDTRYPTPDTRLYRTGDLARFLDGGAIVFLGRIDQQVKLRGFRVEVGEIEAALRSHPAVREAIVLVREDSADDKRLVAYVVLTKDERRTTDEIVSVETQYSASVGSPSSIVSDLRSFLKERLPEHMLPAAVLVLDALPLGPNGKIDRQALPAPDWAEISPRRALLAPRDALELQLTQIWEEVLKVHPIGVTDNFFDLGGHSLSAVGLLARIQKQLKQDLPLSVLFAGPTVEQLAGLLRGQSAAAPASPLVRIQPLGARPPLFLIHPAGGNVLCFFKLAQQLGLDQPCYGLQSPGLEAGQAPLHAIDAMAALYIDALRTVQPQGPYLLGGWSMGGIVAFEMAQQLSAQGHTVALLALLDTGAPQPHGDAPAPNDARLLVDVIGQERLPLPFAEFQQLDLDAQLNIVLTSLQQAQLLPPGASLDQARRLLDVFKTNVAALASYLPQPYAGPITLFKTDAPLTAEQTDAQPAESIAETASDDPSMGWQQLSDQPVAIYNIPGTHETLIFEPHVQILAAQLRACLDTLRLQSAH